MKKLFKKLSLIIISMMLMFSNITPLLAASASLSVSSSTSKVVIGNTFTVTFKISSSTALGSWRFTPSYDTSKFKLVSGDTSVADYASNKSTKSRSYTYKFKAIGTGTGTISVKNAEAYSYSESYLSVSKGSKKITVITQSQLEASYSKNNNLKSLSIDGLKLSPGFNKNTTSYKVEAGANTTKIKINAKAEDSKSKVSGTGTHKVSEGENKFKITVTAQNGTTKTYTIIVNVTDPNPIEITINDEKYTVIKRESSLDQIEGFTKTTTKINEQNIPTLFNETNNLTLVGLKNSEGETEMYIYDSENNTYKLYEDTILDQMKVLPLSMDRKFEKNYEKTTITIEDVEFEALKLNSAGLFIIHARDLNTAEENYYQYDEKTNTMIRFIEEKIVKDTSKDEKIEDYKKIIIVLGAETVIIIIVLTCILISRLRKNKIRKQKIEEEKKKLELEKEQILKEVTEKKESKEVTEKKESKEVKKASNKTKSSTKKKEVKKNEEKKKDK